MTTNSMCNRIIMTDALTMTKPAGESPAGFFFCHQPLTALTILTRKTKTSIMVCAHARKAIYKEFPQRKFLLRQRGLFLSN